MAIYPQTSWRAVRTAAWQESGAMALVSPMGYAQKRCCLSWLCICMAEPSASRSGKKGRPMLKLLHICLPTPYHNSIMMQTASLHHAAWGLEAPGVSTEFDCSTLTSFENSAVLLGIRSPPWATVKLTYRTYRARAPERKWNTMNP